MATLFLAILIVYILLFQIKGKSIYAKNTTHTGDIQISTPQSGLLEVLYENNFSNDTTNLSWWIQVLEELETNKTDTLPINTGSNIVILSGTNVFYWSIEIIDKLWIKYQYALIDTKGIYYINLGTPMYDFGTVARWLWWNIYELKTEAEIAQNKLFWEKITFINLPEYKEKKVTMIIKNKEQTRLIWVDYAIYHKTKWHIKSLFIQQ